ISTTWLEKERKKILFSQAGERKKIKPAKIFSAWLLKVLLNQENESKDTWKHIGFWRQMIRKSFIFEGEQIDIIVLEKSRDHVKFEIKDRIYNVELRSTNDNKIIFSLDGNWSCGSVIINRDIEDLVFIDGYEFRLKPLDYLPEVPFLRDDAVSGISGPKIIRSPLHGRIVKLNAILNQQVNKGELLFTLDAMKIENKIISPYKGFIKKIHINVGQQVRFDQEILVIDDYNDNKKTGNDVQFHL
ncbi:MAG: acetyl-CoA carboxylase biotin carboxyl carrier protein subunit, partial [Bacteroidota bacterium]